MKTSLLVALACGLVVLSGDFCQANPYLDDEDVEEIFQDDRGGPGEMDYSENALEDGSLVRSAQQKRSCVRRGGNCDHRRNDCCYNSSCRCNLWGSNCRCQRVGLFQKWG